MKVHLCFATLLFASACASKSPPREPPPTVPPPIAPNAVQRAQIDENCGPLGMPEKQAVFGPTRFVTRDGYALEHSDQDKIPLWCCERLTLDDMAPVPDYRRPKWRAESQLPPGARAEDEDYKSATDTYDRGHMAPNADFGSKSARDATFYLSNVVPQVSKNNRGIWETLESEVRRWVSKKGEAYIITGPIYKNSDEAIGENKVVVPTHIYKIIAAKGPGDSWEAIAFVAENKAYDAPYKPQLESLIETIDFIEAETNLDFFPKLSEEIEGKEAELWD